MLILLAPLRQPSPMLHARVHALAFALAPALAFGLLGVPAPAQTRTELGKMWLFEKPPLAYLEQEYGFAPSREWLDALRLASLRFGSWCSASFVSPRGLIMTNHHCVREQVAEASPADADWVEDGFYARALEDEVRLRGVTVQQLVAMRDVTTEILREIAPGDDDVTAERKRQANEERVLDAAGEQNAALTAQVVTLHQGAAYHLYLYKVYDDVRLVCAPHVQNAYFGGDPDNFTYPRYCLDFSFCRAYDGDRPADTSAHYFRWSDGGARDGDLVFVTGNPGDTGRLLTCAQMEHLRDAYYPIVRGMIERRLAILRGLAEQVPELAPRLRTVILDDENSAKALAGYHRGLLDPQLMAERRRLEAELRAKIEADPAATADFGGAWDRLAEISRRRAELEPKAHFQVPSYSPHLAKALAIAIAADEAAPGEDRAAAADAAASIEVELSPLSQALFVDHLQRAARWLAPDDPYRRAVLGDDEPAAAVVRIAQSRVGDAEFARQLLEGGTAAVRASDDPAIAAARAIAPLVVHNQALAAELAAQEAAQARLVGQALFAAYGEQISPDATFTLRFSDGVVKGYPYNGTLAPWRTTFYGLYARHAEFEGREPFHLPQVWLDRQGQIDLGKALNFASTNDIIGGNSGSPVVNRALEVVGLIFDGNIEQLPNRFLFRDRAERSVSVHTEAILEALSKVYDAGRVVAELTGG